MPISKFLSLTASLLLLGAVARADVVSPPPEDCPNGARGETCHGGPFCAPWTCESDAVCDDGRTCQERQVCIAQFDCTSGWGTHHADRFVGFCVAGACAEGACRAMRVCASGGDTPADGDFDDADWPGEDGDVQVRTWGCDCRLAPSGGAGGALLLALLPALVVLGARLRRRPPRG